MSKSTNISSVVAIVATILAFLTFLYADEGIMESLLISLLFSSPLYVFIIVFYIFKKKDKSFLNSTYYTSVMGAFILCGLLHVGINSIMLIDVAPKGKFGPAQGYWLLVLIGGTFKSIFVGAIFGVFFKLAYKMWHRHGNS